MSSFSGQTEASTGNRHSSELEGLLDLRDHVEFQALSGKLPNHIELAQSRFFGWASRFLTLVAFCELGPRSMSPAATMLLWTELNSICLKVCQRSELLDR